MQSKNDQANTATFTNASGGEFVRRLAIGGASLTVLAGALYAQPAGEQIVAGNVGITRNGNLTQITASNGAAINWRSFDIGAGQTVQFLQPGADARVLNRVTGPDPTQIAGTLLANGRVYIVNPAGVYFRAGSVVNAGAIYAAAGKVSDADFARKIDRFTDMTGSVANAGLIRAAQVVLTGAAVGNFGRIDSPNGTVIMAAGKDVLIGERNGTMYARVSAGTAEARGELASSGAGVSNTGEIYARGGTYQAVTGDIFGMAIRQGGQVTASRISVTGGNATATTVDGRLDASGLDSGQRGGKIEVTGQTVAVRGATLDASGSAGGGVINVGGGYQGRGELANAERTFIDQSSSINVDAVDAGHGGNVVIWSNLYTLYRGHASARGARAGGDGGFVEVSSKDTLAFRGTVEARALGVGKAGKLLLDPKFIIISDTGADSVAANDTFAENAAATATFDADLITTVLNGGTDLELQANTDITIDEIITVNNGAGDGGMFTLRAGRSILINQNITTDNGAFNAFANDSGATGNRDAGAGVITMASGVVVDTGTGAATFSIGTNALAGASGGALTLDTVTAASIIADATGAATPGSGAAGANTGALAVNGVLTTSTGGVTLRGGTVTTNAGASIDTNTAGALGAVAVTATAGDLAVGDSIATTGASVGLTASDDVLLTAAVQTVGGAFTVAADADGSGAGAFTSTATGTVDTTNAGADGTIAIMGADANIGASLTAGTGAFTFQPLANTNVGVGDTAVAGFNLDNTELAFVIGTGSVLIGDGLSSFVTNLTVDNAQFAGITAGAGNTITFNALRSNNAGTLSFETTASSFTQFAGGLFAVGADAVSTTTTLTASTIDLRSGSDGTGDLAIGGGAVLFADTITLTAGAGAPGTARITFAAGGVFGDASGIGLPGNFNIISDAAVGGNAGDTTLPLATAFSVGGDLTDVNYSVTSFGTITLTNAASTNNANLSLTPGAGASNLVTLNSPTTFTLSGLTLAPTTIVELGQNTTIATTAGSNTALSFGQVRTNADSTFYGLSVVMNNAGDSTAFTHDVGGGVGSLRALGGLSITSPAGAGLAFTGQGGAPGITQSINVGSLTIGASGQNVNTTIDATVLTQIDAANTGVTIFGTLLSSAVTPGSFRNLTINLSGGTLAFNGNVGGASQAAATQRLGTFTVGGTGTVNLFDNLNVQSGSINTAVQLVRNLTTVNAFETTVSTLGFTFGSTVDADLGTNTRALSVNTPFGAFTTFAGSVGDLAGTGAAASLTKVTSVATDGSGIASFQSVVYTTGAQTLQGTAVNLGGAGGIIYNSDTGTITIGDTVANMSVITLNGAPGLQVSSGGAGAAGNVIFAGTVEAAAAGVQSLTVNTAGNTAFNANVGGTTALASVTTDQPGTVTVGVAGTPVNINVNDPTAALGGNITLNEFTATLNGMFTTNGGNFAVGDQATPANGTIFLSGDTSVNAGSGTIGFYGTVDDTAAGTNALSTTSSAVGGLAGEGTQFFGNVGGTAALLSLTTNGAGDVGMFGNATTTGSQNYANTGGTNFLGTAYTVSGNVGGTFAVAGPAIIGSNVVIDTTASLANGTVAFMGTVDDAALGANSLTVNSLAPGGGTAATAGVQFQMAVGGTTALESLVVNGAATSVSALNVSTFGNQTFANTGTTFLNGTYLTVVNGATAATGAFSVAGPTLLSGNTTVNTSASTAQTGTILFSGTVDSTTGNNFALSTTSTVGAPGDTAATAGTRFLGAVGATDALSTLTTNGAAGSVSLLNATTAGDQTFNNTGNTFLNGTYLTTAAGANGQFSTTGPVLLAGNTAVNAGSGTITFNSTVDDTVAGTNTLSTTSTALGGLGGEGTQFIGNVGGTAALLSLTTNGTGDVGMFGNATTTGSQNYANTGGTNFLGTAYTVSGNVGGTFTVAGPALIANNVTVDTNASLANGTVTFMGTVNDAVLGTNSLTVNSLAPGGGTAATAGVQFQMAVGGTTALESLVVNGAGTTASALNVTTFGNQTFANTGSTFLNGTYLTVVNGATAATGAFSVAGPTVLAADTTVDTSASGAAGLITFAGTVDSGNGAGVPFALTTNSVATLNAGNGGAGTQFQALVGSGLAGTGTLASLTTMGAGGTVSSIGVQTTGNQAFNNTGSTTLSGTFLTAANGGTAATGAFNAAGPVILAGNTIVNPSASGAAGNATFSSTIDSDTDNSNRNLTVTLDPGAGAASATFTDSIGTGNGNLRRLGQLEVTGGANTFTLFNGIGATQNVNVLGADFGNAARVASANGGLAIDSTGVGALGNVDFRSTLDPSGGNRNFALTLNDAAAFGNFAGDVGTQDFFATFTTNGAGTTAFTSAAGGGQLMRAITMAFNNRVTVANPTLTTFRGVGGNGVGGAPAITFNGLLDSDGAVARNVTLDATAVTLPTIVINNDVGTVNRLGTLTTTPGIATSLTNFTKTTGGSQIINVGTGVFGHAVTVAHGTLTTFDANVGNLSFLGTVDSNDATAKNLTTNTSAAASATIFGSDVGLTNRLGTLTTGGSATSQTRFTEAASAVQNVNVGTGVFNNAVTVGHGTLTSFDASVGNLSFNSTLDSDVAPPKNITTNTSAAASATVFATDIGTLSRLGILTTGGSATSQTRFTETASGGQVANVTSAAFNNAVTLGHGTLTTFDSNGVGALGNVAFNSTLDSDVDAGLRNATINITDAGASAIFAGDVGRTNATTGVGAVTPRRLGQLMVTGAAASTTAFTSAAAGGQRIDATGMSFANNTTIANATLTAFEANGAGAAGNVLFTGTLNSAVPATFRSARVTTGAGVALATFGGDVGGTNPLGQLVVGGNSQFNGNATLNGDARRISTDTTLVLLSPVPAATDAIQPLAAIGALQPRISFTNTGTLAVGGAVTIAGNNGSLLFANTITRAAGVGARSLALTTTAPVLTGAQYDLLTDAQRRLFIQSYIPAVAFGGSIGSTVIGGRLDSFTLNAAGLRGLGTAAGAQSILSSVVFSSAYQTNNFAPLTVATVGGLDTIGNSPTFQIATTGPITFGQNEKVTAFGNLQLLSNAGAITVGDLTAIGGPGGTSGNLIVGEAGTTATNVLTRAAGRVASVGSAAVATSTDLGVDFVGTSITFVTAITQMGTGPAPLYSTPTGDMVLVNGAAPAATFIRDFPGDLYDGTPAVPLTPLADGSIAGTVPPGTAGNILLLDIRADGPVQRSDRNAFVNQVDIRGLRPILDDLSIKTADREQLRKIDILVRDLPAREIIDALIGRAVYNDRPGVSDYYGATPFQQSKSAPRLSYDAVAKLVSAFNVLEPDRDAVSIAVTDAFNAVVGQSADGVFSAEAFVAYARTQGADTAQGSALARVRELLDLVDILALAPAETRLVKRAIVKRFGPGEATREQLDALAEAIQRREQLAAR
ncbi:MAG: filamentous hemagglutinin N-terminal domain-containing protein [Phycisphaerales bacterium]